MPRLLLLPLLLLMLPACVSKKKVLESNAAYENRIALLQSDLAMAQGQIAQLNLQLAERKGENTALTAVQDKLQARIDELESELQRASNQAQSRQQSLSGEVASRDSLIASKDRQLRAVLETLAERDRELETLATLLRDSLQRFPTEQWRVSVQNRQVLVGLNEALLFKPGITAKVEPSGMAPLKTLAQILNVYPQVSVQVVGHHDNQPIPRKVVPDAWDYTALRAATVARLLTRELELSPSRLVAAGKGEFEPVASNETADGQKQNRRIEFVLAFPEEELPRRILRLLE